jgi:hypothetical protein
MRDEITGRGSDEDDEPFSLRLKYEVSRFYRMTLKWMWVLHRLIVVDVSVWDTSFALKTYREYSVKICDGNKSVCPMHR